MLSIGLYEWYETDWLIIHEAIRREVLRAEYSIERMNAYKYPWQALNLYTWISDYFMLALHAHHDNEELLVGIESYYVHVHSNI